MLVYKDLHWWTVLRIYQIFLVKLKIFLSKMQVNTKEILLNHPSKGLAQCAIPWRQNACDHCKPRTSAVGESSQMLSISSLDISCMLPFSVCCFLLLLFSEKNKISCQMLNLISFTERRMPGYKCRHNDNCHKMV